MLTLTDEDFHRLYTYIKKNYGIDLGKKRQLIVSRLSNMLTANGYTSFKPYVDEIISGQNRDMVTSMLNKLTTNYTYFMREEAHFNYLRDTVLPGPMSGTGSSPSGARAAPRARNLTRFPCISRNFSVPRPHAGIPAYWPPTYPSRY